MDGIAFALDQGLGEQRVDKERSEPIQRRGQLIGVDIKMVVGLFIGSVGIGAAAMGAQKFLVFARHRKGFGTQKQHVLQEMREPGAVQWIGSRPDSHFKRRRGFIGVGVADQNRI